MPPSPVRPPSLQRRVFRGTSVVARGVLTVDQLRSSAWQRVWPDVYADAALPAGPELLISALSLVMPPGAAFGGRTAAALLGARGVLGPGEPVEVIVPPGVRWSPRGDRARVRTAPLPDSDVVTRHRLRVSASTRTAVDLARREPLDEAVVLLDQLGSQGIAQLDAVHRAVVALPRCRGSRSAREAVALADGLAESPQETRVRLLLLRAGLPAPVAQYEVRAAGRFVARVDFGWPEHRLALEYDGVWHAEPGQFARDRERLNRLTAAGWRVLFVTAADLRRPERLAARVAAALAG